VAVTVIVAAMASGEVAATVIVAQEIVMEGVVDSEDGKQCRPDDSIHGRYEINNLESFSQKLPAPAFLT
jgi:hypothetical protein